MGNRRDRNRIAAAVGTVNRRSEEEQEALAWFHDPVERVYAVTLDTGVIEFTAWLKAVDEEEAIQRFAELWAWINSGGFPNGLMVKHPPDPNLVDQTVKVRASELTSGIVTVKEVVSN